MKTQEILTIIGLSCLGLCLLLCLLKMSMKDKKGQANCDKACGMLFFAAAVLIGVSQLLKETSESYGDGCSPPPATGTRGQGITNGPLIAGDNQLCADALKTAQGDGFRSTNCKIADLGQQTGDNSYRQPGCQEIGGFNVNVEYPGVGYCYNSKKEQCKITNTPAPPTPSPTPSPSTPPSTGGGCMTGPTKQLYEDTCGAAGGNPPGLCSCRESAAACGAQYEFSNKNYSCQQGTTGNCAKTNCV